MAKAMRHILIDRARRRKRNRHGGGLNRVDLDALSWEGADPATIPARDDALLLLDDALETLRTGDPETFKVVKLHYFGGMTLSEIAQVVGRSERTVSRRLVWARAWLSMEIRKGLAT